MKQQTNDIMGIEECYDYILDTNEKFKFEKAILNTRADLEILNMNNESYKVMNYVNESRGSVSLNLYSNMKSIIEENRILVKKIRKNQSFMNEYRKLHF